MAQLPEHPAGQEIIATFATIHYWLSSFKLVPRIAKRLAITSLTSLCPAVLGDPSR